MKSASFEAMMDVNNIFTKIITKSSDSLPCNVNIDSSTVIMDTITYTISYNGMNCTGTENRNGKMLIKKNVTQSWTDPGSMVIIIFSNYMVTRSSIAETLILNGEETLENVSGGNLEWIGNKIASVSEKDWGI